MGEWLSEKPEECQICGCVFDEIDDWFIDGRTQMGPWAIMCEECHESYGCGLGTGNGQKYSLHTMVKAGWLKVVCCVCDAHVAYKQAKHEEITHKVSHGYCQPCEKQERIKNGLPLHTVGDVLEHKNETKKET